MSNSNPIVTGAKPEICQACGMAYTELWGRLVPTGFMLYDSVSNQDVIEEDKCPRGLRCPGYDWEYGQQRLFYDIPEIDWSDDEPF